MSCFYHSKAWVYEGFEGTLDQFVDAIKLLGDTGKDPHTHTALQKQHVSSASLRIRIANSYLNILTCTQIRTRKFSSANRMPMVRTISKMVPIR